MRITKKFLALALSLLILIPLAAPAIAQSSPSLVAVYCDGGSDIYLEFSEPVTRGNGEPWEFVWPSIHFYKDSTQVGMADGYDGIFFDTEQVDEEGKVWKWTFGNTGNKALPYTGVNSVDGVRAYYEQQKGGAITVRFVLEELNGGAKDGSLRLYSGGSGFLLADNVGYGTDAVDRQIDMRDNAEILEVFSPGDSNFYIRFSAPVSITPGKINPVLCVYTAKNKLVAKTDGYGVAGGGTIELPKFAANSDGTLWRWAFYNQYSDSGKIFRNEVTGKYESYAPFANGADNFNDIMAYYDDLYGAGCYFEFTFAEVGGSDSSNGKCDFALVSELPTRILESDLSGGTEGLKRKVELRENAYYISEQHGDDKNDGLSTLAPYKTLDAIKGRSFGAGVHGADAIYLEGGGFYAGPCNLTLIGTESKPFVLSSYGTGLATITDANCEDHERENPAYDSGKEIYTDANLTLWDCEYFIVENIRFEGEFDYEHWNTAQFVPDNKGHGILFGMSKNKPTGHSAVFRNLEFHGVYIGLEMAFGDDAGKHFDDITIENNLFIDIPKAGAWISGVDFLDGGPHDQFTDIKILNNRFEGLFGDPTSLFEAQAIGVYNASGILIRGNFMHDVGGLAGLNAQGSNTIGGSAALGLGNCEYFCVIANEAHTTRSNSYCDASAIDIDQDAHYGEIAFNLTYNNDGPAIQLGSWNSLYTEYVSVHHNISYNDVRGVMVNGQATVGGQKVGEAGAIRLFGNVQYCDFFNNTILVDTPPRGSAYCVDFEDHAKAEKNGNHDLKFYNNIFQIFSGGVVMHGNQLRLPTTLLDSQNIRFFNNHYSSGCVFTDKYVSGGVTRTNVSSLSDFRTLCGQETYNSAPTGLAGNPGVTGNFASFVTPLGQIEDIRTIATLDLTDSSPCINAGVADPFGITYLKSNSIPLTLHEEDYHGTKSVTDIGACNTVSAPEPPAILYGDCNDDGAIDLKDVTRLKKYLAKLNPKTNESSEHLGPVVS